MFTGTGQHKLGCPRDVMERKRVLWEVIKSGDGKSVFVFSRKRFFNHTRGQHSMEIEKADEHVHVRSTGAVNARVLALEVSSAELAARALSFRPIGIEK